MKETEQETFHRVVRIPASRFEIAKAYYIERKRIEAEEANSFTCPFSDETFKVGDRAYLIYNDELDDEESCIDIITKYDLTNRSVAFFSSHEKGLEWNHAKFKTKE